METRLNDNEVKEVARMQSMIDSYEGFICALHMMMLSDKEINYPAFTDTNFDKEMNKIWKWVKDHKDNNISYNINQTSKLTMNTFQEKVKELARDYENTQSNSPIAKAYYDGAMAAFKLLFNVDAETIVEKAP